MVRDDSIKNIWRGRLIRYAPLILWIGVIFFLSSGQASMSETSRIIRPILEFLFPGASEEMILTLLHGIRKFAHFAEYAVAGVLAARAFSTSSVPILRKFWIVISISLILLIAGLDEFNQSLDSSRTGSIWDALLDCAGGLTAIALYYLFAQTGHKSSEY